MIQSQNKPYSESCDQNREPILTVLKQVFTKPGNVLEIGAGTGQHAVYFPAHLPHLNWYPTDVEDNIPGINLWLEDANLDNVKPVSPLDMRDPNWPVQKFNFAYSANTVHIMSWPLVIKMFEGIGQVMEEGGLFCLYGPFNYHGDYTSQSNANFDQWLKMRDPLSAIRGFEELCKLAGNNNLSLTKDIEMPANNRLLVFAH